MTPYVILAIVAALLSGLAGYVLCAFLQKCRLRRQEAAAQANRRLRAQLRLDWLEAEAAALKVKAEHARSPRTVRRYHAHLREVVTEQLSVGRAA